MIKKRGIGRVAWIVWLMLFCVKVADAVLLEPAIGPHQVVSTGQTVQLGNPSAGPFPVNFYWNFLWLPAGSLAVLSDAASQVPTFVADLPGTYIIGVTDTATPQPGNIAIVSVTALDTLLLGVFDHGSTMTSCVACHNGVGASGKNAAHVNSTNLCEACHAPTGWLPLIRVDHQQVQGSCINCHTGGVATGKSAGHINSTHLCEACHQPAPTPWIPVASASVDHTQVLGVCSSCHNGVVAQGKPVTHPFTSDLCEACHQIPPASFIQFTVDHTQIAGSCVSCHTPGGVGRAKTATHPPTSNICQDCHSIPPATFAMVTVDHTGITSGCVSCHNGFTASGKLVNHINSTDACESCHQPAPALWAPVASASVDHTQVIGVCSSCHNNAVVLGKGPLHIVTSAECSVCHSVNSWLVVTKPVHPPVTQRCSNCHNGAVASGKPATHRKTKADCGRCHTITSWTAKKRSDNKPRGFST